MTHAELMEALASRPTLADDAQWNRRWVAITTFNLMGLLKSDAPDDASLAELYRKELKEHLGNGWKHHKKTFNL